MKTKAEIRKDIKEIKYYYSKEKEFENASKEITKNAVIEKAKYYNEIMTNAPAKLFDLYLSYVVNNNSQEIVADDWGLTIETIRYHCKKMYEYMQNEINKEG